MYARGREAIVDFPWRRRPRTGVGVAAPEVFKKPYRLMNRKTGLDFAAEKGYNWAKSVHEKNNTV